MKGIKFEFEPSKEMNDILYGQISIDDFREFFNFHFEKEDFYDYPSSLEAAKNFWEERNKKKAGNQPYKYLNENNPVDYAAVIYLKNNPDYVTESSLKGKQKEIIKQAKIFVKQLLDEGNYDISELYSYPCCNLPERVSESINLIIS